MDTVARDWRLAKAWLMRELSEKKSDESLSDGARSKAFFTRLSRRTKAGAVPRLKNRALVMRNCAARWNRCWRITATLRASSRNQHLRAR